MNTESPISPSAPSPFLRPILNAKEAADYLRMNPENIATAPRPHPFLRSHSVASSTVTTGELANVCRVHPETVREWVTSGKLQPAAVEADGAPLFLWPACAPMLAGLVAAALSEAPKHRRSRRDRLRDAETQ